MLPGAVAHERPGTTTNIEGRVSRLGQKLAAPGLAWPDWMIAAELADALGADLGVSSADDLADEIERMAPAYAGLTSAVLDPPWPTTASWSRSVAGTGRSGAVEPIDPMALPGVESVERQGAPPRVGLAERRRPGGRPSRRVGSATTASSRGAGRGRRPVVHVSAAGQLLAAARLDPPPLRRRQLGDRLAVADAPGARAGGAGPTPTTSTGSGSRPATGCGSARPAAPSCCRPTPTPACRGGCVAVDFNLPAGADGPANAAAALIDAGSP